MQSSNKVVSVDSKLFKLLYLDKYWDPNEIFKVRYKKYS